MSSVRDGVRRGVRGLRAIFGVPAWRRIFLGSGLVYLLLYLWTIQDISPGGGGFGFQTAPWERMLERMGPVTFEPVARITVPGLTLLISPLDILVGSVPAALVGLGAALTAAAWRRPEACGISPIPMGGVTLLAGLACLAPGATVVLKIPVPSSFVPIFLALIPAALLLLVGALVLALMRTDAERVADSVPTEPSEA